MPTIRYDVSDVEAMGDFTPAPVGLYIMRIKEMTKAETKDSKQPMGVIVLEVVKDAKGKKLKEKYGNVWHRIPLDNSNPGWTPRLREFTDALGLKPKGSINTDKVAGEELLVKLRSGKDLDDNYRPEVAKIMRIMEEPEDVEDEDEDVEDEGEETVDYSEMKLAELRAEAEERELDVKDILKGRKTAADKKLGLIDALEMDDAEEGDEDEDDEDDDEEEGDEYDDMSKTELTKEARSRGIKIRKGMDQDDIIEALREDDEAEDEDDDDTDDDEDDDADSDEEGGDDDDDDDEDESYDEWDIADLKAELKERGLKPSGSKAILVKRLEKDDESDADPF